MYRVGNGYDVHRLVEGRKLILGGVEIPHTLGLEGHSDADAVIHALCDALLGACGAGDIGKHFPDTDPRWKDISSLVLLEKVRDVVTQRGYEVANADCTIIAEKPKLAPHMEAMKANLANALGVETHRINIKATTTERLGFTGREEGIAASAVALLKEKDLF